MRSYKCKSLPPFDADASVRGSSWIYDACRCSYKIVIRLGSEKSVLQALKMLYTSWSTTKGHPLVEIVPPELPKDEKEHQNRDRSVVLWRELLARPTRCSKSGTTPASHE